MPELASVPAPILTQLSRDALYANYIERQKREVAALKRDETQYIPESFDFTALEGLSNELTAKLERARPSNLAQAARVEGMTPAALTLLLARLKQDQRRKERSA